MKKTISFLILAIMLVSLAGCDSFEDNGGSEIIAQGTYTGEVKNLR